MNGPIRAVGSGPMLTAFANGTVFGTRLGVGSPKVLALHGWGGSSEQMRPALTGFDAISLDLPGFGASPSPDAAWGAAEYASAISPVLDEFDEPPVVLGYSFGGRVAVHLAVTQQERLKALVLTGVPLLRRPNTAKPSKSFQLLKWAYRRGLLSEDRMEAERRKRGSQDYRNATGVMRDVLVRAVNETYEEQLPRITIPVEMVWGSKDTAAPPWIVEEAAKLITANESMKVTIVDGADHFFPTANPTPIQEALRRSIA